MSAVSQRMTKAGDVSGGDPSTSCRIRMRFVPDLRSESLADSRLLQTSVALAIQTASVSTTSAKVDLCGADRAQDAPSGSVRPSTYVHGLSFGLDSITA